MLSLNLYLLLETKQDEIIRRTVAQQEKNANF